MENESKYTLVRSHQGVYGQERLYVTQNNEQITALVLWNEEREQLSVIELKGNIDLDNVDEIAAALNVKGLDRGWATRWTCSNGWKRDSGLREIRSSAKILSEPYGNDSGIWAAWKI